MRFDRQRAKTVLPLALIRKTIASARRRQRCLSRFSQQEKAGLEVFFMVSLSKRRRFVAAQNIPTAFNRPWGIAFLSCNIISGVSRSSPGKLRFLFSPDKMPGHWMQRHAASIRFQIILDFPAGDCTVVFIPFALFFAQKAVERVASEHTGNNRVLFQLFHRLVQAQRQCFNAELFALFAASSRSRPCQPRTAVSFCVRCRQDRPQDSRPAPDTGWRRGPANGTPACAPRPFSEGTRTSGLRLLWDHVI